MCIEPIRAFCGRILGDSFLRTFYTAFNVEERKVGLARATGHRVGNACAADASISGDGSSDATQPAPAPAATTTPSAGDESVPPVTPGPSTGNEDLVVEPTSAPVDSAPEGVSPGAGSDEGESGGSDASGGDDEDEPSTEGEDGGSQEKRDGGVNGGSSSSSSGSGGGSGEAGESQQSLVAVAAAASLGTLIALVACVGVGFMVQRRIRRGASHGHTKLAATGNGGGGLEMSGKSGAGGGGGGGGVVAGAEDDFLPARPGGYRGNGSGSHVYRAAQGGATGVNSNGAGHANGFAGGHEVEDEEDAEVEVDFGIHPGPVAGTGIGGRLGKMFGPGRSGFSAFDDTEEAMMSDRPSGQLGNI